MPVEQTRSEITVLLKRWAENVPGSESELLGATYPMLRALSQAALCRGSGSNSPEATELAHEAYLRLREQQEFGWQNREHFYAIAARMVRRLLIDHIRERASLKRGADFEFVPLEVVAEELDREGIRNIEWLDLDRALEALEKIDSRCAKLVELRYFAGLTLEEVAEILECSTPTVTRMWRFTRAWLSEKISAGTT